MKSETEDMRRSVMVQKYDCLMDRVLPHDTKRRNAYDLFLKSCRILTEEGPASLLRHYNERKRVRILEREQELWRKNNAKKFRKYNLEDIEKDRIEFPKASNDCEVSIVIPVHNNAKFTYNCLRSLSEATRGSFEVIVINDASIDETEDLLKNIENIKIIKNNENQGFIASCNRGAKSSSGKYILFLNNDTILTDNWLEPLVEAIKEDKVGAVGAKLICPDGKLQEAGGIIWKDASGWNYGRGDDPQKPEYNFARDVDYCSGAALLVRKDLFERYGGFDTRFKPAYYEDTDLCFYARSQGYRVLYQPRSVVVHFEGATCGNDVTSSTKRHQELNKPKFLDKWRNVLDKEHYKPDPKNVFLARTHKTGKNILVIDHYVPKFDKDSGSYRMYNFLKILVELGHKVTFIGDDLKQFEPYTGNLQQSGIEVIYRPFVSSIEGYLAANGAFFDIVILSRHHIAIKHIQMVKKYCIKAKIVFDTVDLHFLRESRRFGIEKDRKILRNAEKLKETELCLARSSDITLVVSPIEKEILLKEIPSLKVEVISNIHFAHQCKNSFSRRRDLMFLGGFAHSPNADAVKYFVKEIFPLVKERIGEVKFYVVGNEPPAEIRSLASEDVIVTGYKEDLAPYFNECKVFVAPLRYGAGIKGKINQSMSYGLPVVTTTIGAEGMGLENGINALIADGPGDFADNVASAYKNEDLWNKISINSIDNIKREYSYEVSKRRIQLLIDALIASASPTGKD